MSQLEPPALNDLLTQLTRLESVTTDDVAEYDADNATSSPILPDLPDWLNHHTIEQANPA